MVYELWQGMANRIGIAAVGIVTIGIASSSQTTGGYTDYTGLSFPIR